MRQRSILLNPGPVTLSTRVREALHRGDWCHREPEFAELTRRINQGLEAVYEQTRDRYRSVFLTGSGTSAVEAMLATFAPDDGKTLVVANGVYGERMAAMLAAHRKPHLTVAADWTDPMDLAGVAEALGSDSDISHVAVVHHETTTGRLNALDELGELCRRHGCHMLLDAVSSFGAEAIDPDGWNLAAIAATANKCLHGVPGLSFVLASEAAWAEPAGQAGSVYLDLRRYYAGQHGEGFSPFTQSVQCAFALDEALSELKESGGWAARGALYRARAERIHQHLSGLGVDTLLPAESFSGVLWSYRLPEGHDYRELHDALKPRGFVIYAGQGNLSSEIFRIAHMGDILDEDIERLCQAFDDLLGGE